MIAFFRLFIPTKKPTKLEWVFVALIVVVLVALLLPNLQQFGSGQRTVPVLVHVFDATTGKPIMGAQVTLIKARSAADVGGDEGYRFPLEFHDINDELGKHGITDIEGRTQIEFTFNTDSYQRGSEKRVLWLSTYRVWVYVTADGHGGVVVPLRHESIRRVGSIKDLTIYAPIGLFPPTATPLKPAQSK